MKTVILDGYTLNPGDLSWEGFESLMPVEYYDRTPAKDIISRIGNAEIIIVNKTPISKETIDACPSIKYIGVLATGYDVVDVKYAGSKGIVVTNIPTYGTNTVAQYVFALLLAACHKAESHSQGVFAGKWQSSPDFSYWDSPQTELWGKTIGIIGLGKIGSRVAEIACAFGMEVIAYNPRGPVITNCPVKFESLNTLLEKSHVISLHCPLTEETRGIINKETIDKMKDGAILINTSRGPLVNEEDVCKGLSSGKIGFYAADVVEKEPILSDNPLLQAKNCMITPHMAWAAKEARQRLMNIAVSNLKAFLNNAPINTVGPAK